LKQIFVVLLLFFAAKIASQSCLQHDQSIFNNPLQYLDCKSHRIYPVTLSEKQVRSIIVPACSDEHAQCLMAATYRNLQEQDFDKIIIMCPADSIFFQGIALPLRDLDYCPESLRIACQDLEKLSQYQHFHYYQLPFCCNCSMRQQLKFIEFYCKNTQIIPVIVGEVCDQDVSTIALILADCITDRTLIVFSASIAEYTNCVHTCPIDTSKICSIFDQDASKIQVLQSGPCILPEDLFDDKACRSIFSIYLHLLGLPKFQNVESLCVGYATSCTHAEKMEDVATFGAFILQDGLSGGYKNKIGHYEQLQLLQCARKGLCELFCPPARRLPCMISYEMLQPSGIFASLYRMSDHGPILQGCMGKIQGKLPLHTMAYQMSSQAAYRDVRFYPLRHNDLESTIISLSVIRDVKKIKTYDEIGEFEGLVLQYDDKKAISLPFATAKVPWDHELVLADLSRQLSLHDATWKKPRARIFRFHSIVFQEE
jgi:uncharacterized protein